MSQNFLQEIISKHKKSLTIAAAASGLGYFIYTGTDIGQRGHSKQHASGLRTPKVTQGAVDGAPFTLTYKTIGAIAGDNRPIILYEVEHGKIKVRVRLPDDVLAKLDRTKFPLVTDDKGNLTSFNAYEYLLEYDPKKNWDQSVNGQPKLYELSWALQKRVQDEMELMYQDVKPAAAQR